MVHIRLVTADEPGDAEWAAVVGVFGTVAEALGLDGRECAELLGVAAASLPLEPRRPVLAEWQRRRMRHLIDVGTALGLLVGDADGIAEWVRTPRASHGGRTPLASMLRGMDGLQEVRDELLAECRARFGPLPAWGAR